MPDLFTRFAQNPILRPEEVPPSHAEVSVACVLNPGAFTYQGKIGLVVRVAERPEQSPHQLVTLAHDATAPSGIRTLTFHRDDPDLTLTDPRVFQYRDRTYLTTLSHLRLAWSDDGVHFQVDDTPTLIGTGELETFGIEDCRVTYLDDRYYLTYTAISEAGFGVGLISTDDWCHFTRHGMMLPPNNKDVALFPQTIGNAYFALHRPTLPGKGMDNLWLAVSPDLRHWGQHVCLARPRPGMWDAAKIGAGAAPLWTPQGWLEIYHGADDHSRYCLGALLLDLNDPTHVIARSQQPIMEPQMPYEQQGFFHQVIFTNGMTLQEDRLTIYYGAADQVVCGAIGSLQDILASLDIVP